MSDHLTPNPAEPHDALTAAWSGQGNPDTTSTPPVDLAESVADAHKADQKRLLRLNIQEFVPSVAVALVFVLGASGAAQPWAVFTAAAIALAVGGFLVLSSLRHHRADQNWGGSVRDQLTRRLEQVRHRAGLYRSVAWWYLVPLAAAIVLYRYGIAGEIRLETGDIVYYAICVGFFAVLYRLNRNVGRTQYEPEAVRLEGLLADFDRTTI